jgi:hypothetical protein
MTRGARNDSGFVLAEALVSVVLLALVVGLVSSALSLGRRVAARGEERDRAAAVAAGTHALSTLLRHAVPDRRMRVGDTPQVRFEGSPDRLTFASVSPGEALSGGLTYVTVAPRGTGTGWSSLGVTVIPVPVPGTAAAEGPQEQVLLPQIAGARFSYLGPPSDRTAEWQDTWQSLDRLPHLVALRVTLPGRGGSETRIFKFRLGSE